jgi:hypothetical protein
MVHQPPVVEAGTLEQNIVTAYNCSRSPAIGRLLVSLLDHFQPPLSVTHPWKGFHSAWANAITSQLNDVLPEGFYAIPEVPLGDQSEIDVASVEKPGNGAAAGSSGGMTVWAPPQPRLTAAVDFARVQSVAVHIFEDSGGPQLRGAISLVSPANKDRPRSRLTFAAKCVGYLERGGRAKEDIQNSRKTTPAELSGELAL